MSNRIMKNLYIVLILCFSLLLSCGTGTIDSNLHDKNTESVDSGITADISTDNDNKAKEGNSEAALDLTIKSENKAKDDQTEEEDIVLLWLYDDKEYPLSAGFDDIIKIGDRLYFVRKQSDSNGFGGYRYQLCSIKEDGFGKNVLYETSEYFLCSDIATLNDDTILFFIGDENDVRLVSFDLGSKEISYSDISSSGLCYDNELYFVDYLTDTLYVTDSDFNRTIIQTDVGGYNIYKDKILFARKSSLYMCDLDGGNLRLLLYNELPVSSFSIQRNIVYTYDDYGTKTIDLISKDSAIQIPRADYISNQYKQDFFITLELFEPKIYRISYDWSKVDVLCEIFCSIKVIDNYVYLTPFYGQIYFFEDESYREVKMIKKGIYRMELDGSGLHLFVETGNFAKEIWFKYEYSNGWR